MVEVPCVIDIENKYNSNIEAKMFLILTEFNENISSLRWLFFQGDWKYAIPFLFLINSGSTLGNT